MTKNGDVYESNDGYKYKFVNNRWVRLSGIKIDPAAYRAAGMGLGYVPAPNNTSALVDEALMRDAQLLVLSKAIDEEGLALGTASGVIEAAITKKALHFSGIGTAIGIIYSTYSGIIKQSIENEKHDKEVERARQQIKKQK